MFVNKNVADLNNAVISVNSENYSLEFDVVFGGQTGKDGMVECLFVDHIVPDLLSCFRTQQTFH